MSNKIKQMKRVYHAAIYVRLSKEDGDVANSVKAESNSISNQKTMIKDFLKDKKDIVVVSERVDDGYSGSNFDRPAFKMMLDDIKKGIVDCVVVKDLSRFGREYIDSGRYIERLFPALGVRFIAINDNYDSINGKDSGDEVIIPFKNLINDAYCRDISIKIRSHLDVKRRNGEFIGSFVSYGYRKDENDHNKIVIDPFAGEIVREIFRLKMQGMSQDAIAKALNDKGVLSPMEYKNSCGDHYQTCFKTNRKALWSSVAVRRILENEIYIGNLVQGKQTTPSHKVKKMITRPEKDWVRIEKNHEPIIGDREFALVQRLLGLDTRISPNQKMVYPLAGLIVCADCGAPMVRKSAYAGGKKYCYYVCSRNKETKECSGHRIPVEELEETVLQVLKNQIANVLDLEQILSKLSTIPFQELDIKELETRITAKEAEIERTKNLRMMLYEDMKDGIVTKEDYLELHEAYTAKRNQAEESVRKMKQEIENILAAKTDKYQWLTYFSEHKNIDALTRSVAVSLIESVKVSENKNIEVVFSFADCYRNMISGLQKAGYYIDHSNKGKMNFEWKEAM